ncbi:MAG: class Ib ribonucleoside-diphosphate reductase assembly flavoprotein NrdI [Bacillaceae bacterium]
MLVVYDSLTGNVKRFVNKLKMDTVKIDENLELEQEFVLITYTTGFGNVPERVDTFLKKNHSLLKGVSASGNRNWGDLFAGSADKIASTYNVPIISKFELAGTTKDVQAFKERVSCL